MTDAQKSVCVLGRGIAGLAAAWELTAAGYAVTVVAPKDQHGGATWAAVGVSSVKGNIQPNAPLFRAKIMGHTALPAWLRKLEAESGCRVPHAFTGLYEPFFSEADYATIKERVFHRMFTGCFAVKALSHKDFKDRIHSRSDLFTACLGAFHYWNDGWYDPCAALLALEALLARRKVRILDAEALRVLPGTERGVEVETTLGLLHSDELVVACGVFANRLFAASGIKGPMQEAVDGETLVARHGGQMLPGSVAINAGKMNLVATGDGRIIFGSSSKRRQRLEDASPSGSVPPDLAAKAALYAFLPTPAVVWGIRGRFKDQSPAFGPLIFGENARRLWVLLGFHKSGLQLAPLFARNLVRQMRGAAPLPDDLPFAPARF